MESIRNPSKTIRSGYETWNVWLTSGNMYSGRLLRRNGETVELLTDSIEGHLEVQTIPVTQIARDGAGNMEIRKSEISAMPDDLLPDDGDLDLVVAFLRTL